MCHLMFEDLSTHAEKIDVNILRCCVNIIRMLLLNRKALQFILSASFEKVEDITGGIANAGEIILLQKTFVETWFFLRTVFANLGSARNMRCIVITADSIYYLYRCNHSCSGHEFIMAAKYFGENVMLEISLQYQLVRTETVSVPHIFIFQTPQEYRVQNKFDYQSNDNFA